MTDAERQERINQMIADAPEWAMPALLNLI